MSKLVEKKKPCKKKQLTITLLRGIIKSLVFNPKQSGPMKIVCDFDDASYWETRAIEFIIEAKNLRESSIYSHELYTNKLLKAAQLLVLALAKSKEG